MAAPIPASSPKRRATRRWTRQLAIWVVVLGAMSAGRCRRRDEPTLARTPGPRMPVPAVARPSGPAAPAGLLRSRRGFPGHVLGLEPRASRHAARRWRSSRTAAP